MKTLPQPPRLLSAAKVSNKHIPNALETKCGGENSRFWKYSAEVVNDVRKGAKIQICFEHTLKTFPVKEI